MKMVVQAVIGQSMDKCERAQKERVGRSKAVKGTVRLQSCGLRARVIKGGNQKESVGRKAEGGSRRSSS